MVFRYFSNLGTPVSMKLVFLVHGEDEVPMKNHDGVLGLPESVQCRP